MPHPIQRSACDRCHGQKLRCTRGGSWGACVRCTKVKAVCTWSPSLRRPREQARTDSTGTPDGLVSDGANMEIAAPIDTGCRLSQSDVDFGLGANVFQSDSTTWSGPTFADSASGSSPAFAMSTGSPAYASQPQSHNAISTWQYRFNQEWARLSAEQPLLPVDGIPEEQSARPTSTTHGTSSLPIATIRGLSDLNVELFTLSSAVPKPPTSISQPLSWKDKDFAIDKTFQLSQSFIEALDKLYPRNMDPSSNNYIMPPPSQVSDPLAPVSSGQPVSFDQASFLLVLSCYQRLIETYDDIFGNMQACLDRSSTTAREDYVQMPDVKVGSFSLPDSSALQITLILQLARHLLRRMGVIIKSLSQDHPVAGKNGADDLMSLTFKAVSTRENDLVERINRVRNTLLSLDIL
ncbi:hypothetical protein F5X99DRAFT_429408 [Biscogniauxia marginata]|nr:hypothetical protein F5X99DRAFT_429408 [Biscogniauxia marginata]